jgi:radical SAM superfamily enzyme YgiQ (UPF0313 family)
MKIALVNPRVESYSGTLPPLGLLYIGALLEKNGYEVRIFDVFPYDDRDIPALLEYKPDIVGMTVLTDYLKRAHHLAQIIRQSLTLQSFIVGGVHVTVLPEESLTHLQADIAVVGEGEYTMLELCDHLSKGRDWRFTKGIAYRDRQGNFTLTESHPFIEDLDGLPLPARHLLNFEEYLLPPGIIRGHWSERSTTVMTSRGCPFQCIWCGSQCTFGRKVRYRSVENVLDELEALRRDYQVDTVWFVDDTFTLSKQRVLQFCKRIRERGIILTFGCQGHVKTADEEMFAAMKDAGFVQVDFGVESGSDRVLKALKKNSNAEVIKGAFNAARKAGLRTMATFMFGSPEETYEDVSITMRLAKEIRPNFVSSFFITPYPGTELMGMAVEHGWISNQDHEQGGLQQGPMLTINFTREELLAIRSRFQRIFFFENFISLFLSPRYVGRMIRLCLTYPKGLFYGLRKALRTRVFDDLVFEFLVYYVRERSSRIHRKWPAHP